MAREKSGMVLKRLKRWVLAVWRNHSSLGAPLRQILSFSVAPHAAFTDLLDDVVMADCPAGYESPQDTSFCVIQTVFNAKSCGRVKEFKRRLPALGCGWVHLNPPMIPLT